MKKLLLNWALALVTRELFNRPDAKFPTEYEGNPYWIKLDGRRRLQDEFETVESEAGGLVSSEPEPERAGRVVERSKSALAWKPQQHGGVIVAEPTLVANERKVKERK